MRLGASQKRVGTFHTNYNDHYFRFFYRLDKVLNHRIEQFAFLPDWTMTNFLADTVEPLESTFLTPKKRALYRQAGLPVYVMLQHERNTAASTMRIKVIFFILTS